MAVERVSGKSEKRRQKRSNNEVKRGQYDVKRGRLWRFKVDYGVIGRPLKAAFS